MSRFFNLPYLFSTENIPPMYFVHRDNYYYYCVRFKRFSLSGPFTPITGAVSMHVRASYVSGIESNFSQAQAASGS